MIIENEQSREIPITTIERGKFTLRYTSYRKKSDRASRNEDYYIADLEPSRATFVLCDGVGSSFYGNIGSQILGELILHWLSEIKLSNKDLSLNGELQPEKLTELIGELRDKLDKNSKLATSIITAKDIRGKGIQIELAEKEQRDQFGTQSNFCAGIALPISQELPKGLVLLFWLGNARCRIFGEDKELTYLTGWGKDSDQFSAVWSSKEGVVGQIYGYSTNYSQITSVIVYSDGLEGDGSGYIENQIYPGIGAEDLESLVEQAQSIKDDDISFLELSMNRNEIIGLVDDVAPKLRRHLGKTPSADNRNKKPEEKRNTIEIEILKRQLGDYQQRNEQLATELNITRQQKDNAIKELKNLRRYMWPVFIAATICLILGYFGGQFFANKQPDNGHTIVITAPPIIVTRKVCPTSTPTKTPSPTLPQKNNGDGENTVSPTPYPIYSKTPTSTPTSTPTPFPVPTDTPAQITASVTP